MKKENFFVDEKEVNIEVFGEIFKFKPVTGGDELDWMDDYIDEEEVEIDGKKYLERKENKKKLNLCKLRNITSIPYSKEELNATFNINKEFKDFTKNEKDLFFRKLDAKVLGVLLNFIEDSSKKD